MIRNSLLAAAIVGVCACSTLKAVEPGVIQCVAGILQDAVAGKTFAQVLEDAAPCGGDVLTTVITTLLASNDGAVMNSPAYADAKRLHAAGFAK